MTYFGTFVCYDKRLHRLVHVPWEHLTETTMLVEAALLRGVDGTVSAARLEVTRPDPVRGPGPALSQRVVAAPVGSAGGGRIVALQAHGKYLCADQYRDVTASRDEAKAWEHFLIIEPEEVADLMRLLANRWVLHRTDTVIEPGDMAIEERFRLRFGPLMLALADILPLSHARRFAEPDQAGFYQADLFVDGWKIERVSLYRPLVYYAAFGPDTKLQLPLLGLSLQSLVEFGGYRDEVLVFTDRDAAAVAPFVPPALHGKVHVTTLRAGQVIDYKLARYQIVHSRVAAGCQPLLYLDTDVMFDTAVQPMLVELARSDCPNAPQEGARVADTQPLGAELVQADGVDVGDRRGFNSGTIGFPNLTVAGSHLRLVEDALVRFAAAHSPGKVWQDQPMANYVAVKTGGVATGLLSRYVRFDHPLYLGRPDVTPDGRRGIVHFWSGATAAVKRDAMQAYLMALRAAATDRPPPAMLRSSNETPRYAEAAG